MIHANRLLRPGTTSVLPESDAAVAELLLLVSAGDPSAIDPWLTVDQRRLRISVEMEKLTAARMRQSIAEAEMVLRQTLPAEWRSRVTGPLVVASHWTSEFARNQMTIVSASSMIVFVFIGIYLRSVAWALLAMVPNAVALLLLFGAMGHWNVPMD
jgi:predicted RND superfamily exporter protein